MDSNRRLHPDSSLHVGSGSGSGLSPGPSSRRDASPRSVSPVSPRAAPANPATPGTEGEGASDYFDSVDLSAAPSVAPSIAPSDAPSAAPSSRSRFSRFSFSRSSDRRPSTGPPPTERTGSFAGVRQPSIRIRRPESIRNPSFPPPVPAEFLQSDDGFEHGRPRSISQPDRVRLPEGPGLARHSRRVPSLAMPRLTEEGSRPSPAELGLASPMSPSISLPEDPGMLHDEPTQHRTRMQRARNMSRMLLPGYHRRQAEKQPVSPETAAEVEYNNQLVDWLDTIDPEVQTLSTLTNVQNSLFIPDLGNWVNRRPTYALSRDQQQMDLNRPRAATDPSRRISDARSTQLASQYGEMDQQPPTIARSDTITSRLTDSHYAALPHGTNLEGWTEEEKWELDDHVRHMLHSRRARMKRRMKGFGQYVRRPLGFFVTLYATLITLFGLAWVLFLIGWIYVGEKQVYAIHIIDSVLVALFAIMGDGLAPFRAVDTYHMIHIARLSRKISNAQKGKPPRTRLQKRNIPEDVRESMDQAARTSSQQQSFLLRESPRMPDPRVDSRQFDVSDQALEQFPDLEDTKSGSGSEEFDPSYLTYAQQKKLAHHQEKMAKSHSFYKPQETYTHYAFPLKYLIAIVVLLDFHSCLQISLGACTWGIDYHHRPFALTTVILCVSITCNITAGLVISYGDRKSRKKDVVKLLDRQELTGNAIKHMEQKKRKEKEENGDIIEEPEPDSEKEKENEAHSRQRKLVKQSSASS